MALTTTTTTNTTPIWYYRTTNDDDDDDDDDADDDCLIIIIRIRNLIQLLTAVPYTCSDRRPCSDMLRRLINCRIIII